VAEHTADQVNERIQAKTADEVALLANAETGAIDLRLKALDHEWDIERTLEINFAAVVLAGLGLSALVDRRWALLPAIASLFMIEHVVQGWCPPMPVFRRLGFRTQTEIEHERYALKALRGDFDLFTAARDGNTRADARRALEAAQI
jgi:hypothetical protein